MKTVKKLEKLFLKFSLPARYVAESSLDFFVHVYMSTELQLVIYDRS